MAILGRARRTFIPIALGCCVTVVALTRVVSPASSTIQPGPLDLSTVRLEPAPTSGVADPTTNAAIPQILLSRQLLREAEVRVGDLVTLAAAADGSRSTSFRVAGVYEPTPDPRKFSAQRLEARLHLPDLVALVDDAADPGSADTVSAINLALVNRTDADRVAGAIARRVPGTRIESTEPSNNPSDPFVVLDRFHWAIAIVTVAGSTAFLLALMVMRAEERRDIIGILRLIGVSSRSILFEVLLEGLLIALAGGIFGIIVAVAAQGVINRFFQWRFDTTLVFVRVTSTIAWQAVAFAVPLGVAAGLAASWALLRRSVVSLVGR